MLSFIAASCILIGIGMLIYGAIAIIKIAFETSVEWGVISLLIPIGRLVFIIKHWAKCKTTFIGQLFGLPLIAIGVLINIFLK